MFMIEPMIKCCPRCEKRNWRFDINQVSYSCMNCGFGPLPAEIAENKIREAAIEKLEATLHKLADVIVKRGIV